jgi:hypothetical protein
MMVMHPAPTILADGGSGAWKGFAPTLHLKTGFPGLNPTRFLSKFVFSR